MGCDAGGPQRLAAFWALARGYVKAAGFDEPDNASIVDPVPLIIFIVDHASHLPDPVALGSQTGLVVISRLGWREKDDRSGDGELRPSDDQVVAGPGRSLASHSHFRRLNIK